MEKIDLAAVALNPVVKQTLDAFRAAGAPDNGLRLADYRRWSFVLDRLVDADDLLDIGIGMGQFADAAVRSGRFSKVLGADRRPHSGLKNLSGFEFVTYDLTQPPGNLSADIVTCMECVEHIASPGFERAVEHLSRMARKQLVVTVPFKEPEPLPKYHFQRFDLARLTSLFPTAKFCQIGNWAVADCRM